MSLPRFWSLLLLGLLALALPLFADDAPTADDEEPEVTVVVTADRVEGPQSQSIATATVVTADDIAHAGATSVADVLRLVPGVALKQNGQPGANAMPSLRGTTPDQTLVLVDGMRISNSAFMGSGNDMSKFPVDNIERIEVIRGPVSSLYGSEAIGGVINIITKQAPGEGGSLTFGLGTHGRAARALSFYGGLPQVSWQVESNYPAFDGTRPNSAYDADNYATRLRFPSLKGWATTVNVGTYHDRLGLPGTDYTHTGQADLDDYQKLNRTNYDIGATRALGGGNLTVRTYLVRQRLDNFYTGSWSPVKNLSKVTGTTKAGEATYTRTLARHQLVGGLEFRDERYKDTELADGAVSLTQDKSITNKALFLQDRIGVTSSTDVVLGLRFDDHSTAGSRLVPRVGVTRTIAPGANLRASYAEGFRSPALCDLYYKSPYGQGNPNLRPETSNQYEIGLNWLRGQETIDLAIYRNLVYDEISWSLVTNTNENLARTRHQGIEVSWERRLARNTQMALSYNYLDAINRDSDARLGRLPHHQVELTLGRSIKTWDAALTGRWEDRRSDKNYDTNTYVIVPSRLVVDFTLAKTLSGVRPYVSVRNLLNKRFDELAGYPAEGRSVEAGLRSTW